MSFGGALYADGQAKPIFVLSRFEANIANSVGAVAMTGEVGKSWSIGGLRRSIAWLEDAGVVQLCGGRT